MVNGKNVKGSGHDLFQVKIQHLFALPGKYGTHTDTLFWQPVNLLFCFSLSSQPI
jgi:hypothetical protein